MICEKIGRRITSLIESLRELDDKRRERIMGYVKALKEESE